MRTDEARGVAALVGAVLRTGARRAAELHTAIADRVFTHVERGVGDAASPVRLAHDALSGAVYSSVLSLVTWTSRAAGHGGALLANGRTAFDRPRVRQLLAALNAAHGDRLDGDLAALALPMAPRHDDMDLPVDRESLAAAYPRATDRLAVFVHGLGETDRAWWYRVRERGGEPYGTRLRRELGYTPVWLRYNTGRRVSDNGRSLADLMARLVDAWPRHIARIVLIGHSMGGLVVRSAMTQTPNARWVGLVSDTVTLGSPHLGAPLEQGANLLVHALRGIGETRWLANQLATRSVGIKDLRHGNLVEADWAGFDPECRENNRTHVPLPDGSRHFVVLSTLAGAHGSLPGDLLGDLLVRPRSARGDTGDDQRLAVPTAHVLRLTGPHHFDLLNHPAVHARLREWLAPRSSTPPSS